MNNETTPGQQQPIAPAKSLSEHMERERLAAVRQMDAAIRFSFQNSANFNGGLVDFMKRSGG